MLEVSLNVVLSATIMSIVLWISKTNPNLGGFVVSLPLSTMIVLALSKIQGSNEANTMQLAKSIFIAIPVSLTFFIPFVLADKLKLPFWTAYGSGIGLLIVSFFIHRWIMSHW